MSEVKSVGDHMKNLFKALEETLLGEQVKKKEQIRRGHKYQEAKRKEQKRLTPAIKSLVSTVTNM